MAQTSREIHLAARPQGVPTEADFRLVLVDVSDPADGEVLVRNLAMSVDPYMRPRMNDVTSYLPAYKLDQVLDGGAVGEVLASRSPDLAEGDVVLHHLGWREYATGPARAFRKVRPLDGVPVTAFLGALGMPGLTAYVGLLEIAAMRPGDAVFVSGAAGAVGSLVGQLARLKGASKVVGSAGSAAKVAWLTGSIGFDAAFDYHHGPVAELLGSVAKDGIDVYFDNVGGEHLEAALGLMNIRGRVALCGSVSSYNAETRVSGPSNLWQAVGKRLTLTGFIVSDHSARMKDFLAEVGPLVQDGSITCVETIVPGGVPAAPGAFIGLLEGANMGKMIVDLS